MAVRNRLDPSDERAGLALVPRLDGQGYARPLVDARRRWVERQIGCRLDRVGCCAIDTESMRGNIENPIGAAQVPLGVAGPLRVVGRHARGVVYVPLATTEGALVRSYERGMVALTRAGGAAARVLVDENRVAPVFVFDGIGAAADFARDLPGQIESLRAEAEATTKHGRLLRVECHPVGRQVFVSFCYHTGDAHGMNMIVKATDRACRWLMGRCNARYYYILTGHSGEKRAGGLLAAHTKGKRVSAGARLPRSIVRAYLHATPEQMVDLWHRTLIGQVHAGYSGYNGHLANGLTALFIACGQDVANVANSASGITDFDVADDGDLLASVSLPSLTVGTVGGGTGLGTARECLELLGCSGAGGAVRFAEIVAATLLAGELSMGAALASGEFVAAHEQYGRNRPPTPAEGLPGGAGHLATTPEVP